MADEIYTDSDSDCGLDNSNTIALKGYLSKWTNYIHGWQPRFIVLGQDGTLSYYKSESESDFGCRGAISLHKATVKSHEFDDSRFDVAVNNCLWYLRAENPDDKLHWIEVLQSYRLDAATSANGNINNIDSTRRHGSTLSLQSSTASGSSLKRTHRILKEKVNEIETFKDILYGQIETLQRYFDACADINLNENPLDLGDGLKPIDFKVRIMILGNVDKHGESITFRATTSGVITTLQHCLELINQRDDLWKKKLDKENDKRKNLNEQMIKLKLDVEKIHNTSYPGPDLEEGPHSTLPEDEFFDAVETGLDKYEADRQLRVRLKYQTQQSQISIASSQSIGNQLNENQNEIDDFGTGKSAKNHKLWPEIDKVCLEQLHYAREGVGQGGNGWQLFADEGEMKMYKREEEVNGMVIDPLKACHMVKGVTAREMCHFFFMPEYRNDWETTLEDCTILEKISSDTLVFLQTHKRVWPASQRDALFWSHMRKITDQKDAGANDTWIVCNNSMDHQEYPPNTGKCVRIFLTVILVCQTYVNKSSEGPLTRDDLSCKITYCSVVNPGGWAPASVLRAVYKREYPKFLKRYTQYVIDQCKNNPIMF